ncbi:MAG: hypothetical protein AB1511_00605 [Deinococcota bacterium]
MPDKDDKNKGHTSLPDQYDRTKKEVDQIEDGHRPSFKGVNDREAKAARNTEHDNRQEEREAEAARSVPATNQS